MMIWIEADAVIINAFIPSLLVPGEALEKWLDNIFVYIQREARGMVISGEPID